MVVIRTIPSPVWDEIPALVIPTPLMLMNERIAIQGVQPQNFRMLHASAFTILVLDRDYIAGELLPSIAQQQFRATSSAPDYQIAVVSKARQDVVYRSNAAFVARR